MLYMNAGLKFYNNKLNHVRFLDRLQMEGDLKTADIKVRFNLCQPFFFVTTYN